MRRGRGKGKKQTLIAAKNDEDEKIPASRRKGRAQKPLKDEINEEDDDGKIIEEDSQFPNKNPLKASDSEDQIMTGKWKKRKRSSSAEAVKENISDSVEDHQKYRYGSPKSSDDSSSLNVKSVGFRSNGNRRKSSKPHRAAEVGVECN